MLFPTNTRARERKTVPPHDTRAQAQQMAPTNLIVCMCTNTRQHATRTGSPRRPNCAGPLRRRRRRQLRPQLPIAPSDCETAGLLQRKHHFACRDPSSGGTGGLHAGERSANEIRMRRRSHRGRRRRMMKSFGRAGASNDPKRGFANLVQRRLW